MKRHPESRVRSILSRPRLSRRAAALVFALMALLVASLLIAALIRTASIAHRQLKRDEIRFQANLLADAGCRRAITNLQKQPDFVNEEWTVPAEQLELGRTATVRLTVTTDPAKPEQRIASVVATYPIGHPDLVRISREVKVP